MNTPASPARSAPARTRASLSIDIAAPCARVFDVLHDYSCRLQWDTMLREARLLDNAAIAARGVRSRCVGTWRGAWIPMETEYVQFDPPHVAAVRLTNHPPFFKEFAATIRHESIDENRSRTMYTYSFIASPRLLAVVINMMMKREVRRRLQSLRAYIENEIVRASSR